MTINKKSAAFLAALDDGPAVARPVTRPEITVAAEVATDPLPPRVTKPASSRTGLKHIGGYFDRDDVEKIAILRARLGLDNSQLIKLAVDELYKKHNAQRAFGDAK